MDGSWKFPEKEVQGDSRNFHGHRLTGFEVRSCLLSPRGSMAAVVSDQGPVGMLVPVRR